MSIMSNELCKKIEAIMLDGYVRNLTMKQLDVEVKKLNLNPEQINEYIVWNTMHKNDEGRETNANTLRDEYRASHKE